MKNAGNQLRSGGARGFLVALSVCFGLTASFTKADAATEFNDAPPIAAELSLPIVEWQDDGLATKGIFLAVHGVTLHAKTFDTTARHLASEGYPVYALDLRGFGKWRDKPEPLNKIDFNQSTEDIIVTLKKLRESHPHTPLFFLGESYSANISLYLAAVEPQLFDGIIASSPCLTSWKHPRWRLLKDVPCGLARPHKPMKLDAYVKPSLSKDPHVTETYLADPLIAHDLTPARLIKTILANKKALKEVENIPESMPILILSGEEDRLFKTKKIPDLVSKLGSKNVTLHVLPKTGHLLLECQKQVNPKIASFIDSWLLNQTTSVTAEKRVEGVLRD